MKVLSTVSLLCLLFGAKETLAQKKKPNVLIILADDVGTGDVPGYWGNEIVDMPNLRALQEKGVTFTDAHSTPLCAPSRYSLLSGNQPHRGTEVFGTWGIYPSGQTQFYGRQQSIATMMKSGDYHTSMFGKVSYFDLNEYTSIVHAFSVLNVSHSGISEEVCLMGIIKQTF